MAVKMSFILQEYESTWGQVMVQVKKKIAPCEKENFPRKCEILFTKGFKTVNNSKCRADGSVLLKTQLRGALFFSHLGDNQEQRCSAVPSLSLLPHKKRN